MFEKQGNVLAFVKSVSIDDWNRLKGYSGFDSRTANVVVADLDKNAIYIHGTIVASVDIEKDSGHYITAETERFINDNGDAFPRDEILKRYNTFKTHARTYVEHKQGPEFAKGRCYDAIVRDMGDTVLVDVLFSVDGKYPDLINNINKGFVTHLSMGCQTEFTKCAICGHVAHDESEYCDHVKNSKKRTVQAADGKMRKVAELCFNNTWIDISLVMNPAFGGAVIRNILSRDEVGRQILSNILSGHFDDPHRFESEIKKVASRNSSVLDVDRKREELESSGYQPYHPIVNDTSEDNLESEGFAPIPWQNRYEILDDFMRVNSSAWKCMKCGCGNSFIKMGNGTLHCGSCHYIEELEASETNSLRKKYGLTMKDAIRNLAGYRNSDDLEKAAFIIHMNGFDTFHIKKAIETMPVDPDLSDDMVEKAYLKISMDWNVVKDGLDLYMEKIRKKWNKGDILELIYERFPEHAKYILDEARKLSFA
jgi:hypothetical protein